VNGTRRSTLLLLLLAMPLLGGCGGGSGGPSRAAEPLHFEKVNALVRYARTITPEDERTFAVEVVLSARQDLALLAVTETVPAGLSVIEGQTTAFQAGLQAGERLTLSYRLRAEHGGGFTLQGNARAKPLAGESVRLILENPIEVPQ